MPNADGAPPIAKAREAGKALSAARASAALPAAAFSAFEGLDAIVLAVSGGGDSMALLYLAAAWTRDVGLNAPALHVATVDHGLRPEAGDEANLVASAAEGLGLSHAVLPWNGPKPRTRIQERARSARYALLAAHARDIGAGAILTGHHADDQAETVLLRLCRGSGLDGLGGMRATSMLEPGLILGRPLLACLKSDLLAVCRGAGQAFVDDPSNIDPTYARARLRREATALAAIGLNTACLTRLARRMSRAEEALQAETTRLEARLRPERGNGSFRSCLAEARAVHPEILRRLLGKALAHVSPERAFIRLDRLEHLTAAIETALHARRPVRATLAGARLRLAEDGTLSIDRERTRRRGAPSLSS